MLQNAKICLIQVRGLYICKVFAKIIGGGLSSVGGTLKTAEFKGIVELSFNG